MVRIIGLVLCCCCLAACVVGQTDHYDVLLLKNGAVIKGHITERQEGKKITVRLLDGKTMDVPLKKIQAITSSDEDWQQRQKHIQDSLHLSAPSFVPSSRIWQVRMGGQLTESKGGGCVSAGGGVLSPRSTVVGLSVGFERNSESKYVPLMCELEHYLAGRRLTPFLSFGVGYAIGWLDAYQSADYGGLRIQVGLGLRLRAWDHEALLVRLTAGSQQVAKTNVVTESHIELVHATIGLMLF
jgi:hypothetical protein